MSKRIDSLKNKNKANKSYGIIQSRKLTKSNTNTRFKVTNEGHALVLTGNMIRVHNKSPEEQVNQKQQTK